MKLHAGEIRWATICWMSHKGPQKARVCVRLFIGERSKELLASSLDDDGDHSGYEIEELSDWSEPVVDPAPLTQS